MSTLALPTFKWDAADYAANSSSQYAWAQEMIERLDLQGNEHILDVGCGDGKISAELAGVVTQGVVTGIDASPHMIEFARTTFAVPNLKFQVMDARRIHFDREFNLIFSNAALHWVDDHKAFLRGAASCLRPGGRLVVSCGGKGNAQSVFVAFCAEMRGRGWREFFRNLKAPYFFYSPEDYRQWLPDCGFKANCVELANKDMVFDSTAGFVAWLRTTWLPYTQRVPEKSREDFLKGVVSRYLARHPLDAAGRVHVRMVRLEIDATRL